MAASFEIRTTIAMQEADAYTDNLGGIGHAGMDGHVGMESGERTCEVRGSLGV